MKDHTTQVFRTELAPSLFPVAIQCAGGAPANASPPAWQEITFETVAYTVGTMMVTVGPLDPEKFQVGDKLKVIVQRIGKRIKAE